MDTMTDSPQITVLLADDNALVREGVRALLSVESDFEVVGVAVDYDSLIAGADEYVRCRPSQSRICHWDRAK